MQIANIANISNTPIALKIAARKGINEQNDIIQIALNI